MFPDYDRELGRLWEHGVTRADAERLRKLADGAIHARRHELAAFATVAEMISGGTEALPEVPVLSPDADLPAQVLGLSALAWVAAARRRGAEAVERLEELEVALTHLDRGPRATLCRAIADLAIADCALVTHQTAVARRRLERVIRDREAPESVRVNARIALATRVMDATSEGKRAATMLARAGDIADECGFSIEAAHTRLYGSLVALTSGDVALRRRVDGWLAKIPADAPQGYHSLAAAVRAMSTPGDAAFTALADGVRRATEQGDFVAYWLLLSIGAARYREAGDDVSALATLMNGIAQLERVDPTGTLARPLDVRREAIRQELGPDRYQVLQRAAEELIARDAQHRADR